MLERILKVLLFTAMVVQILACVIIFCALIGGIVWVVTILL